MLHTPHKTNIGALPRRCRCHVTCTGTHGALHSRSAMPWRLHRSLTSSRQSRVPKTGCARALDLGNLQLIGYDLAVLCDCRTVVPLSCTHGKHYPRGTTPRRLPRSIACCLPSLTACRTHSGLEHPSLVILPILKPRNAYNPRTHSEPVRSMLAFLASPRVRRVWSWLKPSGRFEPGGWCEPLFFWFVVTDKAYSSKQIRVALKALKGLNFASACTAESPGAYTTILTSLVAQYIEKQARNALFKTFLKHHSVVKLPNHMISDMGSTLHVLKLMKSPFLKNPFVSQDVVVIVS